MLSVNTLKGLNLLGDCRNRDSRLEQRRVERRSDVRGEAMDALFERTGDLIDDPAVVVVEDFFGLGRGLVAPGDCSLRDRFVGEVGQEFVQVRMLAERSFLGDSAVRVLTSIYQSSCFQMFFVPMVLCTVPLGRGGEEVPWTTDRAEGAAGVVGDGGGGGGGAVDGRRRHSPARSCA